MTIQDLLNKVHVRFEKNTDYPDTSSDDFVVRLGYLDDAITMWEKEAREGVQWKPLKKAASIAAAGNGNDPQPADFLEFLKAEGKAAIISDGTNEWREVSAQDGNRAVQDGATDPYIFWREAGNIRTLPAITGTITFPYLRKATRYPLGTEITAIEIEDEKFLQEFIVAMLYLDDDNLSQYQAHMNNAKDILSTMKYNAICSHPDENDWGFGM
jgi:hypothetical protein